MSFIARAMAAMPNKNQMFIKFLEETQHKHVNVHKGTPRDSWSIPVVYSVTAVAGFVALRGAWDMITNQNRKE